MSYLFDKWKPTAPPKEQTQELPLADPVKPVTIDEFSKHGQLGDKVKKKRKAKETGQKPSK